MYLNSKTTKPIKVRHLPFLKPKKKKKETKKDKKVAASMKNVIKGLRRKNQFQKNVQSCE